MKTVKKIMDRVIEAITVVIFLVMVVAASWQVISRFILQDPSTVTEEFLRFSLIWLSMLAAAYVVGKKSHIAITFLGDKLRGNAALMLSIAIQFVILIFAVTIMIYGGWKATSTTMLQISPALKVPMGLIYLSLPLSGVFATFYSLFNILELFGMRKNVQLNEEKI